MTCAVYLERKKTMRREDAQVEVSTPGLPCKSFSDFENPFQSGMERRVSIPELVRYTFDAMEAWAIDRECGRKDGETPAEFANNLARTVPDAEKQVKSLARIYNQAAYSVDSVGDCRKLLYTLWQRMSK